LALYEIESRQKYLTTELLRSIFGTNRGELRIE
jgi:hypothetical protein